ncbi:hypothetical protein MRX96_016197 [Rhipicephalus microplus]
MRLAYLRDSGWHDHELVNDDLPRFRTEVRFRFAAWPTCTGKLKTREPTLDRVPLPKLNEKIVIVAGGLIEGEEGR